LNLKKCEKTEKCEAEIVIEVNPEEFQSAISKVYIKNRSRISVPGFRKGKAPRKIIEKMYGESIFHTDALEMLVPDVLKCANDESELKFFGQPQIKDIDIRSDNSGVDFILTASHYPEVTIGEYKGLPAAKPDVEVSDSEIEGEMDTIRDRNSRIEKVDRPVADGDIAVIDFEGFMDGAPFEGGEGKAYSLTIGSGKFIPGFEEKLIGMSPGEERELELMFPDEYEESLAGKPVLFKVKLNEVKEKILPDLDDEFVKDVSEFDTLDEYKEDIRNRLTTAKQANTSEEFENELLGKIVDSMEVDLPNFLVESQMDKSVNSFERQVTSYGMSPADYLKNMNVTPEVFRESTRADSEYQVKISLALDKIAELEGVVVSSEEIEDEYKKIAENLRVEIEKIKETVAEEIVIDDIKRRHALDIVLSNAVEENPESETLKGEL